MEVEDLGGRLADEEVLKVEAGLVERDEGVLADGTQLEHLGELIGTFLDLDEDRRDYNLRLIRVESNNDFFLLFRAQDTYKNRKGMFQNVR